MQYLSFRKSNQKESRNHQNKLCNRCQQKKVATHKEEGTHYPRTNPRWGLLADTHDRDCNNNSDQDKNTLQRQASRQARGKTKAPYNKPNEIQDSNDTTQHGGIHPEDSAHRRSSNKTTQRGGQEKGAESKHQWKDSRSRNKIKISLTFTCAHSSRKR